jgi:hypothetical protein
MIKVRNNFEESVSDVFCFICEDSAQIFFERHIEWRHELVC